MKILVKALIILVAIVTVVVLARNMIVKIVVEQGARGVVGLPVDIQKLDIGLQKTYLDIEGLKVGNPKGFGDTLMVDMPKMLVDYNLTDILKGTVHLEEVNIDLDQFTVVKGKNGKLNLDSITALGQGQKTGASKETSPTPAKKMPMQVDRLRLRIGKVVYIDQSGKQPVTKEFNLGIDETYSDIKDQGTIIRLIVFKVMTKTPLAALTNFNLGNLQSSVGGIVNSASDLATQTAAKGLQTVKGISSVEGAERAVKSTTGAVTNGVKNLAGRLKNPFSSDK